MADFIDQYPIYLFNSDVSVTGFVLDSLNVTEAESFAPRITSSKGETDLDGTLHHTFPVNHGFAKEFTDDNQNYRVFGNYNPVDSTLYSPLPFSSISTGSTYLGTTFSWSAKTNTHKASYLAFRENATNKIFQIDTAGTLTALTLPAAVSGASLAITGITAHKTYLYVGFNNATTSASSYRFNIPTATWQDITGAIYKFASLRNRLYGVQISGEVWSVTNEEAASAATYTSITKAGPWNAAWDEVLEVLPFNGAIWITKQSGLYRFDGTDAIRVLDMRLDYMTEYNGALYFVMNGWLCRFNGSLFEKLKYFGSAEAIIDLQSHAGNLMILTRPDTASYKYGGSSTDGTIDNRIFEFDGANFRVIYEYDETTSLQRLSSTGDRLLMPTAPSGSFAASIKQLNFASRYTAVIAGTSNPYIITADFDADLPNIGKLIRRIQVDVDNPSSTDTVSMSFQRYIAGAWTSWSTTFSLTPAPGSSDNANQYLFPSRYAISTTDEYHFERIRLKISFTPTVGSTISLKSATIHYTLHPRIRRKYTLGIVHSGDLELTEDSTRLTGSRENWNANDSYFSLQAFLNPTAKGYTYLAGPEAARLSTSISASDLSIVTANTFRPFVQYNGAESYNSPSLFLLYDQAGRSEVVSVSTVVTGLSTTLTVIKRGMLGTAAKGFSSSSSPYTYVLPLVLLSRVRLISDNILTTPESFQPDSNGVRQVLRRTIIEATEL